LEFQYLREQGRLAIEPDELLSILTADFAAGLCTCPFATVAREAGRTRDSFDRIIVANAAATGSNLITKDRLIRRNFRGAIW
jgi:PIN domain nuclease of toxin-antitoxin system